jgi:hypothetical protein
MKFSVKRVNFLRFEVNSVVNIRNQTDLDHNVGVESLFLYTIAGILA